MDDKNTTVAELKKALAKYDRKQVLKLLGEDALKQIPEKEQGKILQQLLLLRDQNILKVLAEKVPVFPPEMFDVDYNNRNNREIVCHVFEKHRKNLALNDKDQCNAFFEMGCKAGCIPFLQDLIKNRMAVESYKLLATQSDELAALIEKIPKDLVNNDMIAGFFAEAALANNYTECVDRLLNMGFDIQTKNADGKDAAQIVEEYINTTRYPKGKNGDLQKRKNQDGLKYLHRAGKIREERLAEEQKRKKRILLEVLIVVAIVAVAVIIAVIKTHTGSDDSTAVSAVSEEAAETEEDQTLSTDTSLTVEDGDKVSIEYIGYVNGEEFEGGNTNGYPVDLTIGSDAYIDGFEDQLIGAHPGDEVEVDVTFPDDYGVDDLAGQDAVFDVTIDGIYE